MHMKNKSIKRICCTIISTITIMGTALGVSADTADKLYTFSLYQKQIPVPIIKIIRHQFM